MTIDTASEGLVRTFLGFDPTQDTPAGDPQIAGLYHCALSHLTNNESQWLFERPLATSLLRDIETNAAVVFHGEKGTGKTSLLRSIVNSCDPSLRRSMVTIDLNLCEAPLLGALAETDKRRIITEHVVTTIRKTLLQTAASPVLKATLRFDLANTSVHYEPFRRHLALHDRDEALSSPATLALALVDGADDVGRGTWAECYESYLCNTPELERDVFRFVSLVRSQGGTSSIIALDNVDRLDPEAQEIVATIARALSTSTNRTLRVVLTCRTDTFPRIQDVIDNIKAVSLPASPDPKTHADGRMSWDIRNIIERRVDLLAADPFWSSVDAYDLGDLDVPALRAKVMVLVRRIQGTLEHIWQSIPKQDSRSDDELRAFAELAATITEWHNGNIRLICLSIFELITSLALDPIHLSKNSATARKRTRNMVYRHVLFYPGVRDRVDLSTVTTLGDLRLTGSVELFSARPEVIQGSGPAFYFLKFRLLRYLLTNGPTTDPQMFLAMRKYGVDEEAVGHALRVLSGQFGGYSAGIIRAESRRLPNGLTYKQYEALPAGRLLANTLCFTCEYMYWSATTTPIGIELLGAEFPRLKRTVLPTDSVKVRASVVFLHDYLVPRFKEEHPYMSRKWNERDRTRLLHFRRDFGFDRESWFLDRAVSSIRGHAERNRVTIPPHLDSNLLEVTRLAARLTEIVGSL